MNSLRIKRNIMLSGANPVRGYLRTSSGEPPLTLTATYPDKMKVKLYGNSTQPSGTYYTADHAITEAECNYSTRKLWFWGYYDGYVGNYYVFDGFAYWCFSLNSEFYEGNYYIDCEAETIYKDDYGTIINMNIAVTHSVTAPSGYTNFASNINTREGNIYIHGATPCSLGTVNGKHANFIPVNNLITGTVIKYDSFAPSLVYRQPAESVDTAITFSEGTTATGIILIAENVTAKTYPDPVHPQEITSPTAGGTVRGSNYLNTKGGYYSKQSSITIVSDGSIDVYIDNTSGGATVYSTMHLYNTNLLLTPGNTYTKICSSTNYIDNDSTQSLIEVGTSSTVISAIPESARITYINSSNTFVAQSYELTENIYNSVRFTFGVEAGKKLHKNYKINIVSGSTATPYEPYQAPTDIVVADTNGQPVTLYGLPVTSDGNVTIGGQQYLSDVLTDNGDGTGTVTRYNFKKAFDGTESWLKNSDNGDYKSFYLQRSTDGSKSNVDEVCSHAPYISWVDGSFVGTYWWDAAASHGMRIDKKYLGSDYDTLTTDAERVARFKSYLASQYAAGTPVTVLYQLATPTTETVTITKSKAQNGTTVITSDCPYVGAEYYSWEES